MGLTILRMPDVKICMSILDGSSCCDNGLDDVIFKPLFIKIATVIRIGIMGWFVQGPNSNRLPSS